MRWVRSGAVALVALFLFGVIGLYGVAVSSLPQTAGSLALPGLQAAVEVRRDVHGIPVITAENDHDAYYALGFVHAQDRLFQMDFLRRLASGRLAEAVGPAALPSDRFMRTLGLRRLAETSLPVLDAETRAALEAYAGGVNAFLSTREGFLPPEFLALGVEPAPWTPVDSLLWGRLMALRLSGNWHEEALRATLLDVLPPERVAELWPQEEPDGPTTIASADEAHYTRSNGATLPSRVYAALLDQWPEALLPTLASNAWAVAGARTTSGAPLLANDPHLGFGAPILWYLTEIRTPEWTVSGATVPGVPFHIIGHNTALAWGLTTTHSDTMDLFVEEVGADGRYRTPEGFKAFDTVNETIPVRGGEAIPLTVRRSRHGPIVSDLLPVPLPDGAELSLSAAALEPRDRTAVSMRRLNRARSWEEAVEALQTYHAPQQNVLVADRTGNIGYFAPARVPLRKAGRGLVPHSGAHGTFDWTGWLSYDALPRAANPSDGILVNANNRPVPEGYPHLLAVHWPPPYRAARIVERLDAETSANPEAMRRLQLDAVSPAFHDLWPLMRNTTATSPRAEETLARLDAWDGAMRRDRAEPLIFMAWLVELNRELFADELGAAYGRWAGLHPRLVRRVLTGATRFDWCDDSATEAQETCDAQLSAALESALRSLETEFGPPENWRWGAVHVAHFRHPLFGRLPLLDRLTGMAVETDGGEYTVNRGGFGPRTGGRGNWRGRFAHTHGAGLRAVFDLAEPERSGFIIATGQSGHPLSPHYGDLLKAWRDGALLRIGPEDATDSGELPDAVLHLEPIRGKPAQERGTP